MNTENICYCEEITFSAGRRIFTADLTIPENATSIVIFSHGMNSSRHSPRNNRIARIFNKNAIATLLVSLEDVEEDLFTKGNNFEQLANRLVNITEWVMHESLTRKLPIGYFAAGTGAAVAMLAAIKLRGKIGGIVCRNGRPDLVLQSLEEVRTPVLLLVGENDEEGIALNEMAFEHFRYHVELRMIRGASRFFEEHGKLGEVADAAAAWFTKRLIPMSEKMHAVVL